MKYEVHSIASPADPVAYFEYWTDAKQFAEATSSMTAGVYHITHNGVLVSKFIEGIEHEVDPGGGLI